MGKTDDIFFWLNNSIEQGFINDVFFSNFDSVLTPFRDDPGFIAAMNKAGEKQAQFKRNPGI